MIPKKCKECGGTIFRKLGEIKNTRQYVCVECWSSNTEYVRKIKCKHEYSIRSKNKCVHCGKSK